MGRLDVKALKIETGCNRGYWQDRALFQIKYAIQLSVIRGGRYDQIIEEAEDYLLGQWKAEKTISSDAARRAEAILLPLSEDAKTFKLHCVSHAHIDMNWMWRFDETVAITLDTFRTMLDLLAQYPQFTFSQSQASVYKIVEEFGSADMLEEIKRYVKEGRWEVTASTWVEADKNTPNGESMARHLLYTRRYLSTLLGIPEAQVRIDFEPDTFGHSENVPSILADAGIEYYYHCRGSHDPQLVWWRAPSGKRVLSYRDTFFYNSLAEADLGTRMLPYCKELGADAMLKVYGVGDHGGGPSRRDIENIMDMQSWPVYPTVIFSTYHAFFDYIRDSFGDRLPERDAEMNPTFTGCYTSQARIKMSNRIGENALYEAELFGALAAPAVGFAYPGERFQRAWEAVLFSQFHDILTGSGMMDTREYALGQFQRCMATAGTEKLNALRKIAAQIDTSCYDTGEDRSSYRSEGAGTGCGVSDFKVSQVDRGCGSTRIFHVFNAAPYQRKGLAEVTVWDWDAARVSLMEFKDGRGNIVPHQLSNNGCETYWMHSFASVLLPVQAPACGWATYTLSESAETILPDGVGDPESWQRVEILPNYVLENDCVRVVFDTAQAHITSFFDKKSGREWLKPGTHGGFRLIEEDTGRGMTSWCVGRYMNIREFDSVRIKPAQSNGAGLRQSITALIKWGRSTLKAVFSLDKDDTSLRVSAECDWGERGMPEESIPQLSFALPLSGEDTVYCYDVPMGTLVREAADMDLPGNSFACALPKGTDSGFMLSTDTKYGYRGFDDVLSVALIRGSYDPDPTPEYGLHKFKIAAGPVSRNKGDMIRHAFDLWHPFNVLASSAHAGSLPLSGSLAEAEGNAILQAVKMSEDGRAVVFRLYDACAEGSKAILRLNIPVVGKAELVDINEKSTGKVLPAVDGVVTADVPAASFINIKLNMS